MSGGVGPDAAMNAFQATLERLRVEYVEGLGLRLVQARANLLACQAAPRDPAPLQELQRQMHTMAGTAGTLGLMDVGARARAIEIELDALSRLPDRVPGSFAPIALQLQDLRVPHG